MVRGHSTVVDEGVSSFCVMISRKNESDICLESPAVLCAEVKWKLTSEVGRSGLTDALLSTRSPTYLGLHPCTPHIILSLIQISQI